MINDRMTDLNRRQRLLDDRIAEFIVSRKEILKRLASEITMVNREKFSDIKEIENMWFEISSGYDDPNSFSLHMKVELKDDSFFSEEDYLKYWERAEEKIRESEIFKEIRDFLGFLSIVIQPSPEWRERARPYIEGKK